MNLETLTSFLLEEPLSAMSCLSKKRTFVIVIDALDEIDISTKEEFISVFLKKFSALPKWIKFVLTSRPTKQLSVELPHVTVVNIETADSNHTEDMRLHLSMELQSSYCDEPTEEREAITLKLTGRSQGIFLYAHFAIESAKKRNMSLSETSELFPKGISSVDEDYLTRSQSELNLGKEKFINFLKSVVAAKDPLPQPLVLQILGINKGSPEQRKVARKALNSLSLLFPEESNCISAFHKSLADWLIIDEDGVDGHDFCVKVEDGHRVLAEYCLKVLRDVKNHKSFPPKLNDIENYALNFGFHHMFEAGGYEEQLGESVQDLELLSAVWVARRKTTVGNWFQRQKALIKDIKRISDCCSLPGEDLSYLCDMIDHYLPADVPQFVLQYAAYCPSSTELSSKATQLLSSSKYSNCAWIDKQKIYSFDKSFYVDHGCISRSSEHTMVCVGRGKLMTMSIEDGQRLAEVELYDPRYRSPFQKSWIASNDKYVAVYTKYGDELQLRNVRTLQIQGTFELESLQILTCCFLPCNKLAAGCQNKTVRVWNVSSSAVETTIECPNGKALYCTASPAGKPLTVEKDSSSSYSAVLWRSLTPPEHLQLTSDMWCHVNFETLCVSFSPGGKLVALLCSETGSQVGVIKVFDVTTTHLSKSFPIPLLILSLPCIIFIDDTHIIFQQDFLMSVISIDDGSLQELATVDYWLLYQYCNGTQECFAINMGGQHTLYKFAIRNLK